MIPPFERKGVRGLEIRRISEELWFPREEGVLGETIGFP
jgi:hypothetical protein